MTPRFFVTPEAVSDLTDASTWYDARHEGLGGEFLRAVRTSLAAIARDPRRFAAVHGEVRRVLLRRFPYGVYFVVEAGGVVVIAVVHLRQHPRRWQSRG